MANIIFILKNRTVHCLTENETNTERLYGQPNKTEFVKDAFHDAVINNHYEALGENREGTKFAPMYEFNLAAQSSVTVKLRLTREASHCQILLIKVLIHYSQTRIREADEFYKNISDTKNKDQTNIQRQAFAGMLWSKQYFNIDIPKWLNGDKGQIEPPAARKMVEITNGIP